VAAVDAREYGMRDGEGRVLLGRMLTDDREVTGRVAVAAIAGSTFRIEPASTFCSSSYVRYALLMPNSQIHDSMKR
jgi:hypothetical protein